MNREEAKVCIDAIIGTWEICQNQKYLSAVDVEIDVEDIVALKMAITALSQEQQSEWERDHEVLKAYDDGQESMKPCKDAISRQAAIDALKNRWRKTRNYEGIGDDIAEECELYLKQLPSAQPEQRWIPVSERLPEINQRVLVTSYGRVCYAMMTSVDGNSGYPIFRLQDSLNERVICETTVHSEFTTSRITAWMPLPQPYKGESEE